MNLDERPAGSFLSSSQVGDYRPPTWVREEVKSPTWLRDEDVGPAVPVAPVADGPVDERVWDGHRWRPLAKGHKHGEKCGHFFVDGHWTADAALPKEFPFALNEAQRKDPAFGVYDFQRRTYWIRGHRHSSTCFHVLEDDRWVLRDE